jgi:hypothetical protein
VLAGAYSVAGGAWVSVHCNCVVVVVMTTRLRSSLLCAIPLTRDGHKHVVLIAAMELSRVSTGFSSAQ